MRSLGVILLVAGLVVCVTTSGVLAAGPGPFQNQSRTQLQNGDCLCLCDCQGDCDCPCAQCLQRRNQAQSGNCSQLQEGNCYQWQNSPDPWERMMMWMWMGW